jgi:hypothetical protein
MTPEFLKKLGVQPGQRLLLLDAPECFSSTLAEALPPGCALEDGETAGPIDLVLLWVRQESGLSQRLAQLMQDLVPNGAIWTVIPKKKALRGTRGPTFAGLQEAALPLGLVDNKDLGFSGTEYGVRFVIRRELRPRPHSGQPRAARR